MSAKIQLRDGTIVLEGTAHAFQSHHLLQRSILPVFGQIENRIVGLGTAVCVGPGWFITARHVIRDWDGSDTALDESHPRLWVYLETDEPVPATVDGEEDGLFGGLCEVALISAHSEVDIATLTVDLPQSAYSRLLPLGVSLRMPKVGEVVSVTGYPDMAIDGEVGVEGAELLLDRQLAVSVGKVIDQQHERVHRLMRESPGFAITAAVESGMSGGAVMDERNRVIGFAVSSYCPTEEFPQWDSWVAGTAAALELEVALTAAGLQGERYSLAELAAVGGIDCVMHRSFDVDSHTGNAMYQRLVEGEVDTEVSGDPGTNTSP